MMHPCDVPCILMAAGLHASKPAGQQRPLPRASRSQRQQPAMRRAAGGTGDGQQGQQDLHPEHPDYEKRMRDAMDRAEVAAAHFRDNYEGAGWGGREQLCSFGGDRSGCVVGLLSNLLLNSYGARRCRDSECSAISMALSQSFQSPQSTCPEVVERVDAVIESVPPCSATYTLRLLAHADDQRQVGML